MSSLTLSKEEEKRLKGLGFLNNKGTDNFSARILTVNGKVTAAQHRAMADAAEKLIEIVEGVTSERWVGERGQSIETNYKRMRWDHGWNVRFRLERGRQI